MFVFYPSYIISGCDNFTTIGHLSFPKMSLTPFEKCLVNFSEVKPFIPEDYLKQTDGEKCWFTTPPSYTTIRINTRKYSIEEALKTVKNMFRGETKPLFYQHPIIKDCIVVESFKNEEKDKPQGNFKEIIVDINCGNAVLRGAEVFAPGILGMMSGIKANDEVNLYVDVSGTCTKGYNKKFEGEKLYLGHGIALISRYQLFDHNSIRKGVAVQMLHRVSRIPSVSIPPGVGILQNLPAMVCSHVLELNGKYLDVLDMCAAPGNKTCHMAALMENKGILAALDISGSRLMKVKSNCELFELKNVFCHLWDSTKSVSYVKDYHDYVPPFPPSSFDRILLDPPCSGLGQRPRLRNDIKKSHILTFPRLQKALLTEAYHLIKPGGYIVYSTCTITVEENEEVIGWAIKKLPGLKLIRASPNLGMPGIANSGLNEEERQCVQRFGLPREDTKELPEGDTIGFFIAKLTKTSNTLTDL